MNEIELAVDVTIEPAVTSVIPPVRDAILTGTSIGNRDAALADAVTGFLAGEAGDCERWLNRWIMNYVNGNENAGQEMKARFPLREAKVEVKEIPGKPGSYNAVAYLRPWLQMEELTTSLRMVARIPAASS